jgi:hypothetical protein
MFAAILLLLANMTVHVIPHGIIGAKRPTIKVMVHIEKDEKNRGLGVEVVSAFYDSTSQRELDGLNAPATQIFTFKELPEGEYEVWATLMQWDGGKWKLEHVKGENLEVR